MLVMLLFFHIAKVPFIRIGQMYKKVMQNKM